MKLTLGQAAKEAGISKPSLSAAIKKGRLSAEKNESGVYQIDPAELFRVYPKKTEANPLDNSSNLTQTNGKKSVSSGGKEGVLDLLLAERDKLLEEKEKTIKRLEEEKSEIREDLKDQKEQAKRITLLLENQSSSGGGEWEQAIKALEERISNNEETVNLEKEKAQKAEEEKKKLEEALEFEKSKSFIHRLIGK